MHTVSRAFVAFIRDGDRPYRRLVVNDHIVDDAATRLKKQASHREAAKFLTILAERPLSALESTPADAFDEARKTVIDWTDLNASFTDFVVAPHVTEMGTDHVTMYDRHYDAFDLTTLPHRS